MGDKPIGHEIADLLDELDDDTGMTPPQDSVSDVERLRALSDAATRGEWRAVEHDGSIWIDADDEGDMPVALMMGGSPHNQDRADAAFILAAVAFARAALAVPINKIGEDAGQRLADALDREAVLRDALDKLFVQALQSDVNDRSNDYGCEAIAIARAALHGSPAIRRLSTSTDKGVSNGR